MNFEVLVKVISELAFNVILPSCKELHRNSKPRNWPSQDLLRFSDFSQPLPLNLNSSWVILLLLRARFQQSTIRTIF